MMIHRKLVLFLAIVVAGMIVSGPIRVAAGERESPTDSKSKITFDLSRLNDQGLYGPPDGLRALNYEFCIPADPQLAAQVKAIDPTSVIHAGSQGRSKCSREEYLCIGSTHQPGFRTVLLNLAGLPFVKRINQCFFE
jgi:hypothetical protein